MSAMTEWAKPLDVSLVADAYCAYVSETMTFSARVQAGATVAQLKIGLVLPSVFYINTTTNEAHGLKPEHSVLSDGAQEVTWTLPGSLQMGQTVTLCVEAEVRQAHAPAFQEFLQAHQVLLDRERALHVRVDAWARDLSRSHNAAQDHDHTVIAIRIMSRHASHLPSVYRQDDNDLLGRFLMGGERRWQSLERWLDHIEILADPLLAPEPVLAWLGRWADEPEDERWPTAKRRRLLNAAMQLRRWRGTRKALSEHIQLYTGLLPTITEHRASQLQVGPGARLGAGVVLGSGQTPHTFSVAASLRQDGVPKEQHERVIRDIIEAEKPAHTRLRDLTVTWASA